MRETSRLIELYHNLLFKMEKYGDLPTDERKLMRSLSGLIRARADLMEQQHLQAADIVREQRIGVDGNVQRTESRESTPDTKRSTRPHNG